MERGQQFPTPQPTPAPVVPEKPKPNTYEPELSPFEKGANTALNVLTAVELAAGLLLSRGGPGMGLATKGAAATQSLKFVPKAVKAVTKAGAKQGATGAPGGTTTKVPTPTAGPKPTAPTPPKATTPTPPKATTSKTATDNSPTLPKLDDIFKPRTGTAKPPQAETTRGQIKDLFVPPKAPTKTKPLDDLFFPTAGTRAVVKPKPEVVAPKRTTKMTTKKKTEEKPAVKTKTKEEEKATTKADKRLKRINRAKKAAMAAGAAALLAKGKDNSGEEGWKPSGVV
jgi:hypothetical protein